MSILVKDKNGNIKKVAGIGLPGRDATINGQNALTLTPGHNVEITQEGTDLTVGALVPGKNLLINWDFRKPVNRQGKREQDGRGWPIDRWHLTAPNIKTVIYDGYIRVSKTVEASNPAFMQVITHDEDVVGKTVTISALYKGSFADGDVRIVAGSTYTLPVPRNSEELCFFEATFVMTRRDFGNFQQSCVFGFQLRNTLSTAGYLDLYAAKLELGDHQTLARQNENGEWEIIDPPDYDLQYALCSLYSPTTGEWVGSQHSNDNIVDNPNFDIWQRGESVVTAAQNQYCADRWQIVDAGFTATKQIDDDGSPFIRIVNTSEADRNLIFHQIFENFDYLEGKTLTTSCIARGYNGFARPLYLAHGAQSRGVATPTDKWIFLVITSTFASGKNPWNNGVFLYTAGDQIVPPGQGVDVKFVKTELGPVQTLAHQDASGNWVLNDPPPNKALELAKCQRYFRKYGVGLTALIQGSRPVFTFPFPIEMRATPTVSLLQQTILFHQDSPESKSITLNNAVIFTQSLSANGAMVILLSGELDKAPTAPIFRYNSRNDLFAVSSDL